MQSGHEQPRIDAELFVEALAAYGPEHVVGDLGTTELPVVDVPDGLLFEDGQSHELPLADGRRLLAQPGYFRSS